MIRKNSKSSVSVAVAAEEHPAISYLEGLFLEDDHIFFQLIHSTKSRTLLDENGAPRINRKTGEPRMIRVTDLLPLVSVKEATTPEYIRSLENYQDQGWNVFVCMNPFPEGTKTRTEAFVNDIRNLYLDVDHTKENGDKSLQLIDEAVKAGSIPSPHSILETSPGNYHIAWGVETFAPEEAKAMLPVLAAKLGGDPSATDLNRVLRLPGFKNLKKDRGGFVCRLVSLSNDVQPYTKELFKFPTVVEKREKFESSPEAVRKTRDYLYANAAEAKFELGPELDREDGGVSWIIECPWAGHHTTGDDTAMLMVLGDGRPQFNCFHGHCSGTDGPRRGWSDIRKLWEGRVGHYQRFGEPKPGLVISRGASTGDQPLASGHVACVFDTDAEVEYARNVLELAAECVDASPEVLGKYSYLALFGRSKAMRQLQAKGAGLARLPGDKTSQPEPCFGKMRLQPCKSLLNASTQYTPEELKEYFRKQLLIDAIRISFPRPRAEQQIANPFVIPDSALASTKLGDVYNELFVPNGFPLEMALPALATAASVLVPQLDPTPEHSVIGDDQMVNLYTALLGEVHSGKSTTIQWACRALGIYAPERSSFYLEKKFGSTEMMLAYLKKNLTGMYKNFLMNPDEWSFMFQKAAISNSSFTSFMTTSFYRRKQSFSVGNRVGDVELNHALSYIGGIVADEFQQVFNASTLGGVYDRFLFGHREGWKWSYRPYPTATANVGDWMGVPVTMDGSVVEVIQDWNKRNPDLGRVVEICARMTAIFASIDGRRTYYGGDLEKLWPLARNQLAIRRQFHPNAGITPDAQFANAVTDWMSSHANLGEWVNIGYLKKGVHATQMQLGPNVAERALMGLAKGGSIDLWMSSADYKGQVNPLPSDYQGVRPRIGLVRLPRAHQE